MTRAWILGLCLLGASTPPAADPPNVLFIVVDDLNTDLGCYGHGLVKSPHIDRLASRGTRFDRAYCQYAVCAPSRWSFLSGLRPETTTVFDFKTLLRERMPDVVFLPQLFRQNGYFTAAAGKVFHDTRQSDAEKSWDSYADRMGDDPEEAELVRRRYSFPDGKRPFEWAKLRGPEEKTRDGIAARRIAGLMEEKSKEGKPFFLAAGFHKPHHPWTAPAAYFAPYPADRIPPAEDPPVEGIPEIALMTELAGCPPPSPRAEGIAAYYACVSFIDAQVGVLLQAMDRLKLWDNTIVVFFSDHGYHLGDHGGLWAKLTTFERALRTPLIVAAPGRGKGTSCARGVELVDLYPTLADLCGLPAPAGLEGRSLAPLLDRSEGPWDRPARSMVHHLDAIGRSVRTERWRYTEWDEGRRGSELYDHDRDPGEFRNLAADPRHASTVAELKGLLRVPKK